MTRTILLCVLAFCACKKQETVQQGPPVDTTPVATTTAAPSVSVTADTIASAPIASASATPHEHTAAEIEAEKQAAKLRALEEARQFGMIGLVPIDAGELGPGGHGEGIGLGNIGTLGRGDAGTTTTHSPSLRQGTVTVNGRLPPEVIQRIVRQSFGRFKLCYMSGLRSNPSLQGRVVTKYIIDHDGSVKTTQDSGSDLPDQTVVQCVVRAFGSLSYPQPEGGIVTVVFPLIFSPGS